MKRSIFPDTEAVFVNVPVPVSSARPERNFVYEYEYGFAERAPG